MAHTYQHAPHHAIMLQSTYPPLSLGSTISLPAGMDNAARAASRANARSPKRSLPPALRDNHARMVSSRSPAASRSIFCATSWRYLLCSASWRQRAAYVIWKNNSTLKNRKHSGTCGAALASNAVGVAGSTAHHFRAPCLTRSRIIEDLSRTTPPWHHYRTTHLLAAASRTPLTQPLSAPLASPLPCLPRLGHKTAVCAGASLRRWAVAHSTVWPLYQLSPASLWEDYTVRAFCSCSFALPFLGSTTYLYCTIFIIALTVRGGWAHSCTHTWRASNLLRCRRYRLFHHRAARSSPSAAFAAGILVPLPRLPLLHTLYTARCQRTTYHPLSLRYRISPPATRGTLPASTAIHILLDAFQAPARKWRIARNTQRGGRQQTEEGGALPVAAALRADASGAPGRALLLRDINALPARIAALHHLPGRTLTSPLPATRLSATTHLPQQDWKTSFYRTAEDTKTSL